MTSADSLDQQLTRARRAMAKGKVAQAFKVLSAIADQFLQAPTKPQAHRRLIFDALVELHDSFSAAGDEHEAQRVCSVARSFLPAPSAEDASAIVRVLLGSAQFQARSGNLREAEAQFERALAHAEEWSDSESADSVRVPYARHLFNRRHYRQAAALLTPMPRSASTERHKLYAACQIQLRVYQAAMNAYRDALKSLDKSAASAERVLIYCDMARAARLEGYVSEAHGHLREAANLAATLRDSTPSASRALARLVCEEAGLAYADNRLTSAITLYESGIELMRKAGADGDLEFTDALVGLAMSCLAAHRPGPVEALLISTLRTMRQVLGPRSFESATVLSKLAGFYNKQGRFVEAAILFSGVEEIQGKAHLMDRMMDSSLNFEAGLNYQSDGHYVRALNRYRRALQALERLDSAKNYYSLVIHIRMYEIYLSVADETRAESSYREAERMLHDMFGFVVPDAFRAAMTMAACFELQDKDDFAESFYHFALAAAQREGARALTLQACDEYAAMLERMGRASDARALRRRLRTGARASTKKPAQALSV